MKLHVEVALTIEPLAGGSLPPTRTVVDAVRKLWAERADGVAEDLLMDLETELDCDLAITDTDGRETRVEVAR